MKIIDKLAHRMGYVKSKPRRHQRNFQAAKQGRLTASWTVTALTSDETLRRYLRILRARSREQVENNDYAARFMSLAKSNVVGPQGIGLQAQTKRTNDTIDEDANTAIETAWKDWGRPGICDVTGGLSWVMAQELFIQTVATDGEVIVRKIRGRAGGPRRFMLQFLDPELLDVEHNEILRGGRFIRMGIEFDGWARPVAYHFIDLDQSNESYPWQGRNYIRVPAEEIIHRFIPKRVGQKRGVPWMSTAMLRMQMLGGYEEAALVNARGGASKMGFFISPSGEEYKGDDKDEDGNLISEAEPGTMEQLPDGVDFKAYDPTYPHGEFPGFVKSCLRGISSGLNVSYNTLANDLEGVNFSSIRSGVLEDREVWKALQEWMVTAFSRPVYEAWLPVQLAFGLITIGGTPLFVDREEKYRAVTWQPRRWAWVDPLKDMKANSEAIRLGIRSRSEVIREGGRDPEEVWQEIEKERKRLKGILVLDQPASAGSLMSGGGDDDKD